MIQTALTNNKENNDPVDKNKVLNKKQKNIKYKVQAKMKSLSQWWLLIIFADLER